MAAPDKRIKILYTIPNFDTAGSGKALLNIAKRLDASRFKPEILCMHNRGSFFETVQASGIPVHVWNYTTDMKPYLRGLWNCWKLSRQLKKIAPDLIHSFHYSADYSEAISARMAGIKWIYTKKSMSWGGSSHNAWKLRTLIATAIVAQNSDMVHEFFPGNQKVHLVPRGVDTEAFAPGGRNEAICKQYGVDAHERIIICVANLVPVKGVETLIDAFGQLAHQFPEWKVWIVGDESNEYTQKLKSQVTALRLATRITFTGKQTHVKSFLDQAEIFVLPSRMEGSPVALLEAMANGKIVIGSNIPGIRDQLQTFPDNIFSPGDVHSLKDHLVRYLANSKEANQRLGARFMDYALAEHAILKEVVRHVDVYFSVLKHE